MTINGDIISSSSLSPSPPSEPSKFLWFSDLHYDPFYGKEGAFLGGPGGWECNSPSLNNGSENGRAGCDAPLNLIHDALNAGNDVLSGVRPDFVLVTGDFSRHGNHLFVKPIDSLRDVLRSMSKLLRDSFHVEDDDMGGVYDDTKLIIPSLGNNDVTPDYYLDITEPPGNNTMLSIAADAFEEYSILSDSELETFRLGGYFARNITDYLTVISINTVVYSSNHIPGDQTSIDDPFGQFQWLERELKLAQLAGRRVYIVGHIAPTIGSYRKSQLWHDSYLRTYHSLVAKDFPNVVAAQLFGHIHSDEFRVLKGHPVPVLMASSVTPIYGSNPSFRLVSHDPSRSDGVGAILDYDVYFLDLEYGNDKEWQNLYSFRDAFEIPDLSVSSLWRIVRQIDPATTTSPSVSENSKTMDMFLTYLRANATFPSCDWKCRTEWTCVFQSSTSQEFKSCVTSSSSNTVFQPHLPSGKGNAYHVAVVSIAVASAVFVAFVGAWIQFRRFRLRSQYQTPKEDNDVRDSAIEKRDLAPVT